MTEGERRAFLAEARVATLTSIGADGYPHNVAMWYVDDGDDLVFATYGRSQKIKNLERNPRAAALIEDGATYDELRGVAISADVELIRDPAVAGDVMVRLAERYDGFERSTSTPEIIEMIRSRGLKRVVVCLHPVRIATWDHAKLGGTY